MAVLNLTYYKGSDAYSDGDIENDILDMAKKQVDVSELEADKVPYAVLYHMSKVRENILNWYPFNASASVLEIGSGCGAITGMLCERVHKVTSVELSKRRASINYERNKERDNLEIIVGNLNDCQFDDKFDYIILNGVFEYAASFTEGEHPYETFLLSVKEKLAPNGRILIAIENRLGLKYFAGSSEDHTNIHFLGLNNYQNVNSVKTFSKTEFGQLLEDCKLPYYKFYYPYPDYKFPYEIYTDETINSASYGRNMFQFEEDRLGLFDASKVNASLARESVAQIFANSFLIEASEQELTNKKDVIYAKINSDRKSQYEIVTSIYRENGEKYVSKKALTLDAKTHIGNLIKHNNYKKSGSYEALEGRLNGDTEVRYKFLEGANLDNIIVGYIKDKNVQAIKDILNDVYKTFLGDAKLNKDYHNDKFTEIFGEAVLTDDFECIESPNIDIICDNIYKDGETYKVIDCEWVLEDMYVPAAFIMWRLLNELYYKHNELYGLIDREELERSYNIKKEYESVFFNWSLHFGHEYVGSYALEKHQKMVLPVSLDEVSRELRDRYYMNAVLYYEFGKGYSEDRTFVSKVQLDNHKFYVRYELDKNEHYNQLRWDPAERPCIVNIESINSNIAGIQIEPNNAIEHNHKENEGADIFVNNDPNYRITGDLSGIEYIEINGFFEDIATDKIIDVLNTQRIVEIEKNQAQYVNEKKKIIEEKESVIKARESEIKEKEAVIREKESSIERYENSLSWKSTKFLRLSSRAAKKLKRKVNNKIESCKSANAVLYNIDKIEDIDNILLVAGWIFYKKKDIEDLKICFYKDNSEKNIASYDVEYGIEREDVTQALGIPKGLHSGFLAEIDVIGLRNTKAYLEYRVGSSHKQIFITNIDNDTVPSSSLAKKKNIIKSINRVFYSGDEKCDFSNTLLNTKVDIIIPIYNGYNYLTRLFETVEKTKMSFRIIAVNDNSSDERIDELLADVKKRIDNNGNEMIILKNENNLGFLPSVNKAFSYCKNHVALVNTDTELPEMWLERLMRPIIENEDIASSTPYTNSGTICSFPNFGINNLLFNNMTVDEVDNMFANLRPRYAVMPTGVGFCMGMNIEVLKKIGMFDEKSFTKGYGEENDWCQRAIEAGYKNVQVENLFVYHKHGGSFLSEEKEKLIEEHGKILNKKHPGYDAAVVKYCMQDPNQDVRELVLMKYLSEHNNTILMFDHNLGGGATEYLDRKIKGDTVSGVNVIVIRYDYSINEYQFIFNSEDYKFIYSFVEFDSVYELLKLFDVSEIIINELVTYPELYSKLEMISKWKSELGIKLTMLIHDFFAVCPTINLIDSSKQYCNLSACEECKESICQECSDIVQWRVNWKKFLESCDEVQTFSHDSHMILERIYGDMKNVIEKPHQVNYMPGIEKKFKTTESLNIGLLGTLAKHKGLQIVRNMVEEIERSNLNVNIILIGSLEENEKIESEHFKATGRYTTGMIPRLIFENDIDIFCVTAIWPETFSYTTEEIIKLGMPVAAFNIGAPVERIKKYSKGFIIDKMDGAYAVSQIMEYSQKNEVMQPLIKRKKVLFVAEYISFSSRYRLEHMREELYYNGVTSDFIEVSDSKNIDNDISDYEYLVIYRCRISDGLEHLIKRFKDAGKTVMYDIDDYIFDYNKIKNLDFMQKDDYKDFEEYTDQINACMQLCDEFITSTDTMKKVISEDFSQKPVYVNRNVASAEMLVQSLKAKAIRDRKTNYDKVILGYFSGSKTHDLDFDLIAGSVIELMDKYKNLYLHVVGCIELDKQFNKFSERIIKTGFVDWRELPFLISSVDINLMPLEQTIFHCCKSENKWMEAGLVGVPTVASYNEELAGCICDGEDGILFSNTSEFVSKMTKLIESAEYRNEIGNKAFDKVTKTKTTLNVKMAETENNLL